MKARRSYEYLTPERARKLVVGRTYGLGYDDFNRNEFRWTFVRSYEEDSRLMCVGVHVSEDGEGDWEHVFYEYAGPHHDRTRGAVMCSGSGAERIYFKDFKPDAGVKIGS